MRVDRPSDAKAGSAASEKLILVAIIDHFFVIDTVGDIDFRPFPSFFDSHHDLRAANRLPLDLGRAESPDRPVFGRARATGENDGLVVVAAHVACTDQVFEAPVEATGGFVDRAAGAAQCSSVAGSDLRLAGFARGDRAIALLATFHHPVSAGFWRGTRVVCDGAASAATRSTGVPLAKHRAGSDLGWVTLLASLFDPVSADRGRRHAR